MYSRWRLNSGAGNLFGLWCEAWLDIAGARLSRLHRHAVEKIYDPSNNTQEQQVAHLDWPRCQYVDARLVMFLAGMRFFFLKPFWCHQPAELHAIAL